MQRWLSRYCPWIPKHFPEIWNQMYFFGYLCYTELRKKRFASSLFCVFYYTSNCCLVGLLLGRRCAGRGEWTGDREGWQRRVAEGEGRGTCSLHTPKALSRLQTLSKHSNWMKTPQTPCRLKQPWYGLGTSHPCVLCCPCDQATGCHS